MMDKTNTVENTTCSTSEYCELGSFLIFLFDGILLPVAVLFGCIANILSLIVLTRPSMTKSRSGSAMNIALVGLTGIDLLFILAMFWFRSVGQQYTQQGWIDQELGWWIENVSYPFTYMGRF